MKKITTLLFIVISAASAFSQEINFPKERLEYFRLVNRAELAICRGSYGNAISFYDSAMHCVKNPDYRDLYNLALCQKNSGNSKVADSLFVLLLSKGYGTAYIGQCVDTITHPISKVKQIQVRGKNLDEVVNGIFEEDQRANRARATNMEAYAQVVVANAKTIMALSHEVDNLFQLDVGGKLYFPILHFFQFKAYSERVKSDSVFRNHWYAFQFLAKCDFDTIGFTDFMKEQVANGNFDRYRFADLLAYGGIDCGVPVRQFNSYIVVASPELVCKEELQSINRARRSCGLESYEDFFIKVRFADSLLTNGKPFSSIPLDKYPEMIDDYHSQCNFKLADYYRKMYGFRELDDAKKAYEKALESLCAKKDSIE